MKLDSRARYLTDWLRCMMLWQSINLLGFLQSVLAIDLKECNGNSVFSTLLGKVLCEVNSNE
jgi:hypothetical protein